MKCPNDSATLVTSERAGVEIDWRPECRGVWLDRGELDRIRPRPSHDDRHRRYEDQAGDRRKKKEHWLEELFG